MLRVVRHYPALLALSAQLGTTLSVGLALYLIAQLSPWRPTLLAAGLLQGLLAATLARYLGLSRWWCGLNLLFVPALLLASVAPLPSWVFLGGFVLLLLLNRAGVVSRADLIKARRYVIVGITVIAAVVTPPDVISQLMLAVPLWLLYESALAIMWFTDRKAAAAAAAAPLLPETLDQP